MLPKIKAIIILKRKYKIGFLVCLFNAKPKIIAPIVDKIMPRPPAAHAEEPHDRQRQADDRAHHGQPYFHDQKGLDQGIETGFDGVVVGGHGKSEQEWAGAGKACAGMRMK